MLLQELRLQKRLPMCTVFPVNRLRPDRGLPRHDRFLSVRAFLRSSQHLRDIAQALHPHTPQAAADLCNKVQLLVAFANEHLLACKQLCI